jgi:hypothetical protein
MLERSSLGDAAVLAHQGGWDEILLVAGPIVVIVGLLALAKHRVERKHRVDGGSSEQTTGDADEVPRPPEPTSR